MPVRGAKQRALLALLALQRGQPVSADRLIDALWGDGQAANPANALQAQIGQLRRTFGAAAIVTSDAGYALDRAARSGRRRPLRAAGDRRAGGWPPTASWRRRQRPWARRSACGGVSRWPSSPMPGFFDAERARLDELTLVATESRAGAELGLGRHGELAGELEALCREHPLRERLWELLILALYRSGRQAEALRAYAEVRDRLAERAGPRPRPGAAGAPGPHPGPGPVARPRPARLRSRRPGRPRRR